MKPLRYLTYLAAALVALALPLAASAFLSTDGGSRAKSGAAQRGGVDEGNPAAGEDLANDEVEQEGTLALGEGTLQVTSPSGVVTCTVPAGVDLSALAGQNVEVKCELVDGVWVLTKVESEDGETGIEVGDVDHSGPGNGGTLGDDNSGPGSVGDDDDTDTPSVDDGSVDDVDDDTTDSPSVDDDGDHSGHGGGGGDDGDDVENGDD